MVSNEGFRGYGFSILDIFFKKNEEVIWSSHLPTYLLKLSAEAPQYFGVSHRERGEKRDLFFQN
jgi:hypothetical protein